jgi:hypothetical protein
MQGTVGSYWGSFVFGQSKHLVRKDQPPPTHTLSLYVSLSLSLSLSLSFTTQTDRSTDRQSDREREREGEGERERERERERELVCWGLIPAEVFIEYPGGVVGAGHHAVLRGAEPREVELLRATVYSVAQGHALVHHRLHEPG